MQHKHPYAITFLLVAVSGCIKQALRCASSAELLSQLQPDSSRFDSSSKNLDFELDARMESIHDLIFEFKDDFVSRKEFVEEITNCNKIIDELSSKCKIWTQNFLNLKGPVQIQSWIMIEMLNLLRIPLMISMLELMHFLVN